MTVETAPALAAIDLHKSFGPTRALQGASLELAAGQIHALLGENGSGKSTFAKIVAGAQTADRGAIRRDGREIVVSDPAAARAVGIVMVFQELSLAPDLDVASNMFLGREQPGRWPGCVDNKVEQETCRAVLGRLGLDLDPRQPVRALGMAQKQMLEIGKALSQDPAVLILDEPTASLTRREIEQLFGLVRRLRDARAAILYVTHHLREVLEIADTVSIMRDGRIVANRRVTAETTEDELIELLMGRAAGNLVSASSAASHAPLLDVAGLRTATCTNVSLHVGAGEIVGLYGVVGCGREEVGRALVGLHPLRGGRVTLGGEGYAVRNPADALARGVGFLPSDRKQEGVLPNRPIRENLTLASLRALVRGGLLRQQAEQLAAAEQLRALSVKYASAEDLITTLSGGNQQKVLFGRTLAARPKLLVLEDPTAGIDVGAKQDLYRSIRSHAEDGMGFLWMSSDLAETLRLCDRVYAMYAGRIVMEIVAPSLDDEERLLAAVLGRSGSGQRT
jgi:ribose transport system ATP-binding protein